MNFEEINNLEEATLEAQAKGKNIIPIAYPLTNFSTLNILVSITSLCHNAFSKTFYDIYLITNPSLNMVSKARLNSLKEKYYSYCRLTYINVNEEFHKRNIEINKQNENYYLFMLSSIFDKYEKMIYLDSDSLVLHDLEGMYNLDMKNNYFLGVPHRYGDLSELLLKTDIFINTGIMLINLKNLRDNSMSSKFFMLADKYENKFKRDKITYKFRNHFIINAACIGKIGKLPLKYGYPSIRNMDQLVQMKKNATELDENNKHEYTIEESVEAFADPYIIHYDFVGKPWKGGYQQGFSHYFWKYAAMTPVEKSIYEKYKINYRHFKASKRKFGVDNKKKNKRKKSKKNDD